MRLYSQFGKALSAGTAAGAATGLVFLTIVSLNSCSKNNHPKDAAPAGWHLVWNDEFNRLFLLQKAKVAV